MSLHEEEIITLQIFKQIFNFLDDIRKQIKYQILINK